MPGPRAPKLQLGSHLKYTLVHDLVLDVEFRIRQKPATSASAWGSTCLDLGWNFKGTVVALVDPQNLEHLVESTSPSESWNASRGRCNAGD
jgi:hypothetical protein